MPSTALYHISTYISTHKKFAVVIYACIFFNYSEAIYIFSNENKKKRFVQIF